MMEFQFFILYQAIEQIPMEEDSDKSFDKLNLPWPYGDEESNPESSSHKTPEKGEHLVRQLNDLNRAKQRFKEFLEQIGELKRTPVREDVLVYCGGQKKSDKAIENYTRPDALIKKIQIRIEKMLKTKRIKRNWGEEDLKILIWIISKYSDFKYYEDLEKDITHQDWRFIASLIPGVTAEACMFKWLSIKKITLATHNWTRTESDILAHIVRSRIANNMTVQGEIKDWKEISQELYRLNQDQNKVYRNAKQCREHWTCYLSPHLKKGPWQLYEDIKLLKFIKDNKGLKKWSQIARHFEGRTENALKNRYTLIIDKQKKHARNKGKSELQLIGEYLQKSYVDQFTVNVKMQQDSIFQDNSQMKMQYVEMSPGTPKAKNQFNCDTNDSAITPVRVQKFNINDFESMNIHFFKNIQPGMIQPDGTFKKIPSCGSFKELSSQAQKKKQNSFSNSPKKSTGPFMIIPLKPNPQGTS